MLTPKERMPQPFRLPTMGEKEGGLIRGRTALFSVLSD